MGPGHASQLHPCILSCPQIEVWRACLNTDLVFALTSMLACVPMAGGLSRPEPRQAWWASGPALTGLPPSAIRIHRS